VCVPLSLSLRCFALESPQKMLPASSSLAGS
jgi:hypothetical protein